MIVFREWWLLKLGNVQGKSLEFQGSLLCPVHAGVGLKVYSSAGRPTFEPPFLIPICRGGQNGTVPAQKLAPFYFFRILVCKPGSQT